MAPDVRSNWAELIARNGSKCGENYYQCEWRTFMQQDTDVTWSPLSLEYRGSCCRHWSFYQITAILSCGGMVVLNLCRHFKKKPISLGANARPTPNSRGTWTDLRPKMVKLAVNRMLVGKVLNSSYVTHQKVISYSWMLAITRTYSPLKSTSSTTAFNRQKQSWNLSVSLASDPTRSWSRVGHNSLDGLVCHSTRS